MRWGSIVLCLTLTLIACGDDEQASADQGTDGDGGHSSDNPHDEAASYCVEAINMYRASIGVAPLQRWIEAETCSNGEAASDAMTSQPHGAFGACDESAQNECPGWPGPPEQLLDGCLAQMWAEGPGEDFSKHGHYLNMSNANFTMVACGFHETTSGSWWAVQNFK